MNKLFRFSSGLFGRSSFSTKALGFASLVCLERIYHYNVAKAYVSTPFDTKLQEQLHRNIPELDNFFSNVVLLTGNANPELADEISKILGVKLGNCSVGRFADGEVSISINDSVRGKDIFLIQDRKTSPRVPISAADVARLLETVGVDRVISIDLHCGQIQGFFGPRVPVDNLEANMVALNYFVASNIDLSNVVIVSPDAGGVARAKKFQELFNKKTSNDCSLAMIIKQREGAGKIASMNLVGSVEGKNAIIIDDMIDTAGTLCEAAKTLKGLGALSVSSFATHGLFSGNALKNISSSVLENVIVTNTTPKKAGEDSIDKITRLSVAPILAETIYRIQKKQSVADLFSLKEPIKNQ